MATMDVFKGDAFSTTSLTAAVDKLGYVPQFLGSVPGLFVPPPLGQPRTPEVWIESRANGPALIQTSPRGSALTSKSGDLRSARPFKTSRLAEGSRITASELMGIRAFGTETELKQVQTEVARRQMLIGNDFELTKENMRLGAVQGLTADADGSTIYAWDTEFGEVIPAEVDFDLDAATPAAGILRTRCTTAVRSMTRALKGLGGNGVSFMALCSDTFWDLLIAHTEVRQTYLNYAAAASLRDPVAWETFYFGGITWTNYRGTDDNSTVAVPTNKAKFFPVGAGIFQEVYAPGESFEMLGAPGQANYSMIIPDLQRDMYADVEMYSYPLMVCTVPSALYRARMT